MKILSIDTSTNHFSLAVVDDKKVLAERNVTLTQPLSSSIIPSLEAILKKVRLKLTDMDAFSVGLGPGSFTSLRVGLATVKGLAFVTGKPVVGISSLDALALGVPEEGVEICALSDAKRKLFYASFYEKNASLERTSDYLLTDLETILKRVKGKTYFVGDGIPLAKEGIVKKLRSKGCFAPLKLWYPEARYLADLARERIKRKKFDRIDSLVPLYLYPEDCQVKK